MANKKTSTSGRKARLAEQLRENLKRRKAQFRARAAATNKPTPAPTTHTGPRRPKP